MLPNLDIDQLKTFLAIADVGNFTRAAEEVNKTQSAVSMQLKMFWAGPCLHAMGAAAALPMMAKG
jgi:Bacterial regulatory helix-turn-helix protein, lysR family